VKLPPFMRSGWWWAAYALTMGGAIGLLIALVLDAVEPVIWITAAIVAQVGACWLVALTYRSRGSDGS
jgi:hypothetical protein